jgi:phage-related protein
MADIMMPDGSTIRIPDFALELTAKEMLIELKKLNKDMDADLEKLVKATKEQIKQQADQETAANKDRDEQSKTLKKIADNRGKFGDGAVKALSSFGTMIGGVAKGVGLLGAGVLAAAVSLSKLTLGGFVRLGETLNEMTTQGVAFTDGVSSGGMGAIDAMSQLRLSGIDAAKVMMSYSNVVQSLGKRSFVEFNKSFMDATDSGALLGMSLDESANRLGRELSKRQQMGALDASQREVQIKQITTTLKRQQAYATALGVSTEELQAFTDSLLTRTPALTASLNRLSADLRGKVIAGITDFGTAMRAMGGTEGGAIAEAFTEAAAMGGIGFSDSLVGYVTAMPSLAGPANEYIKAVQSGTLTQDQANDMAQNLTRTMGNATQAEKDRIFALARAGNAQAQSMANAITQFEQSRNKLVEINSQLGTGLTMDGVQEGTNRLQSIFRMLGGAVDSLKMQFLQGLGSVKSLTGAQGALKDAVDRIKTALFETFNRLAGTNEMFEGVGDSAESLGAWFGRKLPAVINLLTNGIVSFITSIPDYIKFLKGVFTKIGSFINNTIPKIKKQFDDFKNNTLPELVAKFDIFKQKITDAYNSIVAFKDGVLGFLERFGLISRKQEQATDADGKPVYETGEYGEYLLDAAGERIPVMISTSIEKVNWTKIGLVLGAGILVKFAASKLFSLIGSAASNVAGRAVGTGANALGRGAGASGLGKGIGAGLTGIAGGLKAFANPAALAGLAAVTLAINGIAFALRIAAPAFEPLGNMFKSIAEGVAPVLISALTTIGNIVTSVVSNIPPLVSSIADVISSVLGGISDMIAAVGGSIMGVIESIAGSITGMITGTITAIADGIATVINAVKGDQEAMMRLQTEQLNVVNQSILDMSGIPSENLLNTARGISAIADAMKNFADTVIGREGGAIDRGLNLFRGTKTDETDAFVNSMNRFAAIDGERIAFNAQAIINANRAQAGMTDLATMASGDTVIDQSVEIVSSDVNEIASAGFANISDTVSEFLTTLTTNISNLNVLLTTSFLKLSASLSDSVINAITTFNTTLSTQLNNVTSGVQNTVDISDYTSSLDHLAPVIPSTSNTVDIGDYETKLSEITDQQLSHISEIMDPADHRRNIERRMAEIRNRSASEDNSGASVDSRRDDIDALRARMQSARIAGMQTPASIASNTRLNQVAPPVSTPTPVSSSMDATNDATTPEPDTEAEQRLPDTGASTAELMIALLKEQQITNRLLRQGNSTSRDLVRSF